MQRVDLASLDAPFEHQLPAASYFRNTGSPVWKTK